MPGLPGLAGFSLVVASRGYSLVAICGLLIVVASFIMEHRLEGTQASLVFIQKHVAWEGGSGWGTHVNPWLIHVNVWQKPLQYCKVISLQLIKINEKNFKKACGFHSGARSLHSGACGLRVFGSQALEHRLSSCSTQACLLWHVGSSQTRDWTRISCIGRQTLYQLSHHRSPVAALLNTPYPQLNGAWNTQVKSSLLFAQRIEKTSLIKGRAWPLACRACSLWAG